MGCGASKAIRIKIAPESTNAQSATKLGEKKSKKPTAESHKETVVAKTQKATEGDGPLTKVQIAQVQDTWRLVKETHDLEQVGVQFYLRLFMDSPDVLPLFSFRDIDLSDEAARSDERLKRQALVTMQHVDLAVTSLNDLGSIVPALKDLGARHVTYNVQCHHYEPVGAALLKTLHSGLGENFTTDVKEAWTMVYGILADTMKQGAKELIDAQ